jgi:hypothetical protein
VFGKSARLPADIDVARWNKHDFAILREAIQATLRNKEQSLRLIRPLSRRRIASWPSRCDEKVTRDPNLASKPISRIGSARKSGNLLPA